MHRPGVLRQRGWNVLSVSAASWQRRAAEIIAEIEALGLRTEVRVIVIRADGKGFCAGVDIKELNADQSLIVSVNAGNYATFKAVHLNKVPVIAAVQGFVLGGGIGICGAADIVIAADDATFGLPEVDRGAMGGAAHLQRMFGVQKTRYLFFTGEMIGAPEARSVTVPLSMPVPWACASVGVSTTAIANNHVRARDAPVREGARSERVRDELLAWFRARYPLEARGAR